MLTESARSAISFTMTIGCFLKIFPYGWDPITFRLTKPTRFRELCFLTHATVNFFAWWFINIRLVQTIKDPIPNSMRVINFVWAIAFGLSFACNLQFVKRRDEIRHFANTMFAAFEKMEKRRKRAAESKKDWKWYSRFVILSTIMLYTNPTAHAFVLIFGPCAAQYISSVIHDCPSALSMPLTVPESLPYVLWENYLVGDNLFRWSFNWTLIYLGFLYVTEILKNENSRNINVIDSGQYRQCQILVIMINDSFHYYLEYFPSVLFTMAGMMLFCTIRYTNLMLLLYLVFPFCGLRCLYEAVTALQAAGKMNQESRIYLKSWAKKIGAIKDEEEQRHALAVYRSCSTLQCNAGPLYTFENSIVLVSLFHCSQLTFNIRNEM